MFINLLARLLFFSLISLKKFQANTNRHSGFFNKSFLLIIGIFIPGRNLPCLSLLSSTIESISFEVPKKLSAVVAQIRTKVRKKLNQDTNILM